MYAQRKSSNKTIRNGAIKKYISGFYLFNAAPCHKWLSKRIFFGYEIKRWKYRKEKESRLLLRFIFFRAYFISVTVDLKKIFFTSIYMRLLMFYLWENGKLWFLWGILFTFNDAAEILFCLKCVALYQLPHVYTLTLLNLYQFHLINPMPYLLSSSLYVSHTEHPKNLSSAGCTENRYGIEIKYWTVKFLN